MRPLLPVPGTGPPASEKDGQRQCSTADQVAPHGARLALSGGASRLTTSNSWPPKKRQQTTMLPSTLVLVTVSRRSSSASSVGFGVKADDPGAGRQQGELVEPAREIAQVVAVRIMHAGEDAAFAPEACAAKRRVQRADRFPGLGARAGTASPSPCGG